jgi:transposase-like protein
MGVENGDDSREISRIERVRCLGCGVAYVKPTGGGTVFANPGCPDCGYVGWVKEGSPVMRDTLQLRFVGDPLRRRTG